MVSGDVRFTVLEAGGAHTCGLSPEGTTYCWGANDTILSSSSAPVLVGERDVVAR